MWLISGNQPKGDEPSLFRNGQILHVMLSLQLTKLFLPCSRHIELYYSMSTKLGAIMCLALGNVKREVICDILSFKSQHAFWSHAFPWLNDGASVSLSFQVTMDENHLPCQFLMDIYEQ